MKTVHLLYFAAIRDLVGKSEEELDLPPSITKVTDLIDHLQTIHPALVDRLASVRIAVNEEFANPADAIHPGDTIALIPPVAGG